MAMRPSNRVMPCGVVASSGICIVSSTSRVSGSTATKIEFACFRPSLSPLKIARLPCWVFPVGRHWFFRISVPSGATVRCLKLESPGGASPGEARRS